MSESLTHDYQISITFPLEQHNEESARRRLPVYGAQGIHTVPCQPWVEGRLYEWLVCLYVLKQNTARRSSIFLIS